MKNQKGSVLLEFAFVITILIVVFMGTVTLSFLYSDYYAVQKVAREGAREACITGSEDQGRQKALEAAWLWGLDPNRTAVEFERDSSANRAIETCTVRYIARPFDRSFPTLVNGTPLRDVQLNARASFGWRDFTN
ncbi:MAG: TadE/TadG family type IV pilus assembly protein [Bacillota bacterium]